MNEKIFTNLVAYSLFISPADIWDPFDTLFCESNQRSNQAMEVAHAGEGPRIEVKM